MESSSTKSKWCDNYLQMQSFNADPRYVKHIEYARTPSHATLKLQDPNFVPPKHMKISAEAAALAAGTARMTISHAQEENERKRARDTDNMEGRGSDKRQKEGEEEEEMDMEVEEQPKQPVQSGEWLIAAGANS